MNVNYKKAWVAILISDKVAFRTRNTTRNKEGIFIMIKGSIHEDVKILNVCAHNIKIQIYEAKNDRTERRNGEVPNYGYFNTPQ